MTRTKNSRKQSDIAPTASKPSAKRVKSAVPHDQLILKTMLYYNYCEGVTSVKIDKIESECGIGARNKNFRAAFNDQVSTGNIAKSDNGEYWLTEQGAALAETYDEGAGVKPLTNKDHQERLKSRLKGKGSEVFDLLLAHGTFTRKEGAAALNCNDRSHNYSYGLQSLRIKGREIVVVDAENSTKGKQMLVLSEKAFFTKEDYAEYKAKLEASSFPPLPCPTPKPKRKGGKAKKKSPPSELEAIDSPPDKSDDKSNDDTKPLAKDMDDGAEPDKVKSEDATKPLAKDMDDGAEPDKVKSEDASTEGVDPDDDAALVSP